MNDSAFALRASRFQNNMPSGKADGMYVRPDGKMTDHPPNALIFDTVDEAWVYLRDWRTNSLVTGADTIPMFIVEVETIRKVKRQLRVVK